MIKKIKLKHLPLVIGEYSDFLTLLRDVGTYRDNWIWKTFGLKKSIGEMLLIIDKLQNTNPKDVKENPECKIFRPDNIDNISFSAMIEIQMFMSSGDEVSALEQISSLISMACFSENVKGKFSSDSFLFKSFKQKVLNQPIMDMFGLYNWIEKSLFESEKMWNELFAAVEVDDDDYAEAGGEKLSNFNVVETIKSLCNDFNVSYDDAWQLSYALSQTNSLSKATKGRVQYDMSKIKERKMKMQRAKG